MSNVIPAEEAAALQTWNLPEVEGPSANRRRDWRRLGELEAVERAAWDESYAAGLHAGEAAGLAQFEASNAALDQRVQQFDEHLSLLARPLVRMDEQVQRQVAELAITLARHLLRRELRTDPAQIIAIVRETVGLLPAGTRDVQVQLHPDDATLLRERLAKTTAERAWNIVEDPVLARGDCRVTAEAAEIDARLESRLNSAMAALLGEERVAQRNADLDGGAAP
jgi:flagellar assembly protein FliH